MDTSPCSLHRKKDLLLNCLRSIEDNAEDLDLQLVVVDNNSRDGSEQAVEAEFPNVELIQSGANIGFAAGCNKIQTPNQ